MEKEITIISYDREKASTIINFSQSLEDLRNQFNVYSAKQESLLLAQLEMLKNNDIGMPED